MSKRQMLSQIWCLASCGQFVHLYHLFCMQSNAIFHFYYSLYLFERVNSWICLIHRVVHLFWCHIYRLQVNFGTAAYEILNYAKLWYRTVWYIIDTGNFTIPVYRASLLDCIIIAQVCLRLATIKGHSKMSSFITQHNVTSFEGACN